jgi:FkbM family methyltransferase
MFKRIMKQACRRRVEKEEVRRVAEIKQLCGGYITLLDIGSAGGIEPRWRSCRSQVRYIGVEPDSRSSAALLESSEAKLFAEYRIVPMAVWDKNDSVTLNFCRKPMVSSHFMPRRDFVSRYPLSDRFDVLSSASMSCQTIDKVLSTNSSPCDFIKLDIQGGELAVLQGAESTLKQCLGLEIEIEFLRIYEDQPLFGDICAFLQARGIEFIDFVNLNRWERTAYRGFGQCVFGDALFLRTPEGVIAAFEEGIFSIDDVKRYLAVLRIYSRLDLLKQTLNLLSVRGDCLDDDYLRDIGVIIGRLEKYFSRASFGLRMLNGFAKLSNPDARLHLIY